MIRPLRPVFHPFALLALLAPLATQCGDSAPRCQAQPCASAAWMHIPITAGASQLDGAKVTVCRNDECHGWSLPALPGGGEAAFPDAPFLRGALSLSEQDGSITLDIQWTLGVITVAGDLDAGVTATDGDHYVVALTTSGGIASILLDQLATYAPYLPNGADCPPVCMQARLSP
jgi:hypothetical protein